MVSRREFFQNTHTENLTDPQIWTPSVNDIFIKVTSEECISAKGTCCDTLMLTVFYRKLK